MSTWVENNSELLGLLTGVDSRDGFAKRQQFSGVDSTQAIAASIAKPPLVAQNDILELVYEVMKILRKWLQKESTAAPPTALALLNNSAVQQLFSEATQPMVEHDFDAPDDRPKFAALERGVKGLVTEAWIERMHSEFVDELSRSLERFQTRRKEDRAKYGAGWQDALDGGVVLYEAFRPKFWEVYQKFWDQWAADMARIHSLVARLQQLDKTLDQDEGDS